MHAVSKGTSLRIVFCMLIAVTFAYSYIDKQNDLTRLRLMIPVAEKELKAILEDNVRLSYQIDCFECPTNLIELLKKPEFSYLKFHHQNHCVECLEL